jgi:hypothetical protein
LQFDNVLLKIVSMQQMVHPVFVAACRVLPEVVLRHMVRFLARCQTDHSAETLAALNQQQDPARGRKRRASRGPEVQTTIEDWIRTTQPKAAGILVRGTTWYLEQGFSVKVMTPF